MLSTIICQLLVLCCLATVVSAFNRLRLPSRFGSNAPSSSSMTALGERVNTKIDLTTEKVVSKMNLNVGETCVVCRCWKSAKFPVCDGAHVLHNKETGDNLGPAIIAATAAPSA